MRKQTKVVAVASAAALLAIGASMTSFAATGWVEEDGTWYFYDKDGNRVEDAWKKSGDNWYWLDSEEGGAMAVDKLVEDDDDTYYVDSNGVMVRNTWVKVVNEDQDDDDDPAEYNYYYMQSNGKAYKSGNSNDATRFKTIDGKRYAFDEDGKMLYGWVNLQSERESDEDSWADATYYLGNWDDGAMKTGWQRISVYDDVEDEDFDHWFYFKSNGKKFYNDYQETAATTDDHNVKTKTINGKKYGFDTRGVMVYEWMIASSTNNITASTSEWQYFGSPEDGARKTKGWFKVVAPDESNDNIFSPERYDGSFAWEDADDETERWYYANGDGELAQGEIKKIKGKYYAFRPDGDSKAAAMLTGLCALEMDPTDESKILNVIEADMDADDLDDAIKDDAKYAKLQGGNAYLFYFGSDDNQDQDGAMKVGSVSVNLDGDAYNFNFSKTGGAEGKGRGLTGTDDQKYVYKYGLKLKAGSDDKYLVVYANADTGSDPATTRVEKIDSAIMRAKADEAAEPNKDGDTVSYYGTLGGNYYLLNTSGAIVKNKTAARDGNDWYYYVDNKVVKMYTNNKNLNKHKDEANAPQDLSGNNLKDEWNRTDASTINSGTNFSDTVDDLEDK